MNAPSFCCTTRGPPLSPWNWKLCSIISNFKNRNSIGNNFIKDGHNGYFIVFIMTQFSCSRTPSKPKFSHCVSIQYVVSCKVWQYRLWSFQGKNTKLDRILVKNQHTQRKLLNFENWTNWKLNNPYCHNCIIVLVETIIIHHSYRNSW